MNLSNRLRHRVDVEERVEVRDDETGALEHTWRPAVLGGVTMTGVPAEVLTGPGREMAAAGTKLAEASARIQLRWFPGLRPDMRIVWEGEPHDILSIETDRTARREYRLRVRSGVTDGA
jgi:head-tail adaptor